MMNHACLDIFLLILYPAELKYYILVISLSKLTNVVKNDVFKETVYDKLAEKVNNIDTVGDFVLKTKYQTDKTEIEKKIPDTSGLVEKKNFNTKITEIDGKFHM